MKRLLAYTWRFLNIPKKLQLIIMRFANDAFLIGVTGIVFNDKNEVLLVKHTYRQTSWSLPGGYLKAGEHPKKGVEREIFEETGMRVTIDKLFRTIPDPQTARLDISCYGRFISGTFRPSAETSDYGFFHYQKLPKIGTKQTKLIEKVVKKRKALLNMSSPAIEQPSKTSLFERILKKIKK